MVEVFEFPKPTPVLCLDLWWWDPKEFIEDSRSEYSNDTGSYADYTVEIEVAEFISLVQKYRPEASLSKNWNKKSRAKISVLDAVVELLNEDLDKIRVTAYEWESGLD